MMSRVSRHHGTLRHSNSSIVGLPRVDPSLPFPTPSLLVCIIYFSFFITLVPGVCVFSFNPGCYHLSFPPLCCCITAIVHKSCLISPRSIHLLQTPPPLPLFCYAHFIYSPRSLAFMFTLYHSSHAGTLCFYSTRLTSCLLHFS